MKLSELRVVAFTKFAKESVDYCDFVDIEYQKLIACSVTRWLSLYPSLPRMFKMYPASHSYFMSIHRSTVVLKRFFGNSLSEVCWRHNICNHFWLFLMRKFRILRSPKHHLLRTENRRTCCDKWHNKGRGKGGHLAPGAAFWDRQIEVGMLRVKITKCQRMQLITIKENVECQRLLLSCEISSRSQWFPKQILMNPGDVFRWGCELSNFALIL